MRKIIFVDCFNSIILRKSSDKDVLFSWSEKLGAKYEYDGEFFYNAFIEAQHKLGKRAFFAKGETEYKFEEIIEYIYGFLNGIDKKEFHKAALSLYIQAEKNSHVRNDELYDRLLSLKEQGNSLYIVSDFYCGKQIIHEFLQSVNADIFEDIFVSCDYDRSKRSGALYRRALKEIGARRKDAIMIGDNGFSDVFMARLNLMKAKKIKRRPPSMSKTLKAKLKKNDREREYDDIYAMYGDKYNFSNYAFPLYLFIKRLYDRFISEGGKDLFFCSREGQFLKKLFDTYCDHHGYKVNTHYLYASRNSVLLAGLKPIKDEDFYYIKNSASTMNTSIFLCTLSFTNEQIKSITTRLGIKKEHRKFGYYRSKTFKRLLADEEFQRIYDENRKKNSEAFTKYMGDFGIDFQKDGLFMVDVGWKGTIQNYINKFFGGKVDVHGYYIGILQKCEGKKVGLLCSKGNKRLIGNKLFRHRIHDYEQILRADHNRVAGYEIVDNKANVIFGDEIDNRKIFEELISPMQEQIYSKFLRIMKIDRKNSDYEYTACKYYCKMMSEITDDDSDWLERCEDTHYDYYARIGFTFKIWGHSAIKLFHGAQNLIFKLRLPIRKRSNAKLRKNEV